MNFRPVFFMALSAVTGVVFSCFAVLGNIIGCILLSCVFLICIFLFCIFGLKCSLFKRNLLFTAVFLTVFLLGGGAFTLKTINYKNADLGSPTLFITGRISDARKTDSGERFVITSAQVRGAYNGRLGYDIYLYVSGNSGFDVGSIVSFNAALYDKDVIYEYKLNVYPMAENVKYDAYVNADELTQTDYKPTVFEKVNLFFRNTLSEGLGSEEFAVAYAMLCGNSDYMDEEILTGYRNAGIAHIFAVSGLHVGFLATALNFILSKLRCGRTLRLLIVVPALFFYSGVCGFSSSSVRAAIMSAVLLAAGATGNKYDGINSISLAALAVVLISPLQVFCVGFQLSFIVAAGMIFLSKPFAKLFFFLPAKLASSLGAVFAAQTVSIPVSLAAFGEVSLIAVLFNLVFIPFSGVLYILTFTTVLLGGIAAIPHVTLFVSGFLLKGVNFLITALDYGFFIVGGFSLGIFCIPYYGAAILCSDRINLKKALKFAVIIVLSAVCAAGSAIGYFAAKDRIKVYVTGSGFMSTIIMADENALIVNGVTSASLSGLRRAAKSSGIGRIDKLFFPKSLYQTDCHQAITRLRAVFSFDNVYICAEEDDLQKAVLEKSFPDMTFYFCGAGDGVSAGKIYYSFVAKGYAVEFSVEEERGIVFSELGGGFEDYGAGGSYRLTVAADCEERLFAVYRATEQVVYRRNPVFADAESRGNYFYEFSA